MKTLLLLLCVPFFWVYHLACRFIVVDFALHHFASHGVRFVLSSKEIFALLILFSLVNQSLLGNDYERKNNGTMNVLTISLFTPFIYVPMSIAACVLCCWVFLR